ncbi:hypothetical protein EVAR_23441_1 [Eumeta japonica]|uniref:Uncharacterized protein n=1 Tax=Eumeta variegata TaxID=151549 RepID=A0A4C1UJQ5_EUMVA|nr:hypothetical protein EVAR_23441_1 [Eumeta japonica]
MQCEACIRLLPNMASMTLSCRVQITRIPIAYPFPQSFYFRLWAAILSIRFGVPEAANDCPHQFDDNVRSSTLSVVTSKGLDVHLSTLAQCDVGVVTDRRHQCGDNVRSTN